MIAPMKPRRRRSGANRVAVVYGAVAADAAPDEQDVLVEVDTVQQGLAALGYAPVAVPLTLDLEAVRQRLLHLRPAFIFNLVESVEGQGRLIHLAPPLFDSLGLPYTGAQSEAVYLTSNKPLAKRLMAAAGIDTPPWLELQAQGLSLPPFPGPYIVKSVWEHASIGIDDGSVVADARKVAPLAHRSRRRFGGDWFAEQFIDGREFNLALLGRGAAAFQCVPLSTREAGGEGRVRGVLPADAAASVTRHGPHPNPVPQAGEGDVLFGSGAPGGFELLPPAEMLFVDYPAGKPRIVDYAAKWHEGSFEYVNTVRRFDLPAEDRTLLARLESIACACWRLFGLSGYARVDCRIDADGRPWVLEVNINPCLSPDAGFAAAASQAGLGLTDILARIIADIPGRRPVVAARAAMPAAPLGLSASP